MYLIINRDELKRALNITQKALPSLVIQEERSHILVRVSGNEAIFSATNNDFKALYKVALEESSSEDFSFTMEPKTIGKLLVKTKIPSLKIETDNETCITKIYTSEDYMSFMEAHSFTEEVMLTFEVENKEVTSETTVDMKEFLSCLDFSKDFLETIKVDRARYDFIVFGQGMAYAANGSNKMSFRLDRVTKNLTDFRIRKVFLPLLTRAIDDLKGTEYTDISVFNNGRDTGFRTLDNRVIFTSLVSNEPSPDIKKEYVSTAGSFCTVDRRALMAKIDRLGCLEKTPNSFGIEVILKGTGSNASIELNLVSSLKGKEVLPCTRSDKSSEDVMHVIDNKVLKGILSSFSNNEVQLYINEPDSKLFKVYETQKDADTGKFLCHSFAIGSYSKILKRR